MKIQSLNITWWSRHPIAWDVELIFSVTVKSLAGGKISYTCFNSLGRNNWLILALLSCMRSAFREQRAFRINYYADQDQIKRDFFASIKNDSKNPKTIG